MTLDTVVVETKSQPSSKSPGKSGSDDANEQYRTLIKKRGVIKARLTKFVNHLQSYSEDINALSSSCLIDLKLRVEGARSLYTEFNDLQTQIEMFVPESSLEDQLTQRDRFEDSYYGALALAESLLDFTKNENAKSSSSSHNTISNVRLPTISLPTFDGSYENWLTFRDTYLSLVHNAKDLSDIQKFHYLKSSLSGSALLIIDALELTTSNYTVAWELLLNRYDNNRLLIHNHVKALFCTQASTKESHVFIRQLIDTTLKNLRALTILGEPVSSWDTLIIYILVSKLDKTTEREWEQFKSSLTCHDTKMRIKLDDLLQFLKGRADMLETLQASQSTSTRDKHEVHKKHPASKANDNSRVHCNVSTNSKPQKSHHKSKFTCSMCHSNHPLYSCVKFLEIDYDSKLKLVKTNNLCENCLRAGHSVESCAYGPCRKCNKKHNSIIHPPDTNNGISPAPAGASGPVVSTSAMSISAHSQQIPMQRTHESIRPVLLSTALVEVKDKYNNYHIARCLLDNGSQRCFATKSLSDLLGSKLIQSTHEIHGVGNSVTQCTQTCDIQIKSRINTYTTSLHCLVLPKITATMPIVCDNRASFCIPDNIQLADPHFLDFENIDILIGADKFWDLLTQGKIRLHNGPYLLNTRLGWIVSGPINLNARIEGPIQCNFTHTTDSLLRRFWEIEELPTARDTLTDEEKACEEHFTRTTTRDSDGRFCVSMPLKQSPEVLGETYPQAERRFLALEKRLQRSEPYKKLYSDFIHEYEDLGHMTKVPSYPYDSPHVILPHHGVFREHSTTTKLRVVFDGSAASSSGTSLNDLQMVGPAIQGDLLSILLRFRQHRYVACADIAKMYRQVLIAEQQRDLQLILWRDSPDQPIGIYRLNRVSYGTSSAPYLSVRCLKQLATECTDPDVKRIINEDFYVDDMITGSHDKHELLRLCNETARILQLGCFPLRKWTFNFNNSALDPTLTALGDAQTQLTFDKDCSSKTLGIGWNNYYDHFYFDSQYDFINNCDKVTKRSILSHVSQIYDPLGLLSPTIMQAKILLQRLWLLKLDWDDEVPSDVTRAWHVFVKSISVALSTIRVPRYVMGSSNYTRIELHIFTDASQVAYGTCIYIRTINDDMEVSSRLLCSKGKVSPLKPLSIPRLELCGALLGAKLFDKVKSNINCQFDDIVFWSDSTIVLGWLRMPPNLLKTFVQNRVTEIHDLTKGLPWRHVSGKENPADLVSRGVNLEDLASSSLWWSGPGFLQDTNFSCTNISQVPSPEDAHDILPEVKPNVNFTLTANTEPSLFPFERFSQFSRMIRAAGYVLRFIHNTRNKNNKRTGSISVDELRESTTLLTRLAQLESFPGEYKLIVDKQALKPKHNLSKFSLFVDDNRVMRVGGRIAYSQCFSFDKKHPIVIDSKHHFALLLFRHEHIKLLHAAPQALLFELHDTWWPIGGRNLAKRVYYDCVVCKRLRGKTLSPLMGNLPEERITPGFPFCTCGVDYAGPVYILNRKGRGARKSKAYICLFICFVTRAIHLELVSDLTSGAYLLALQRFVARRGKPAEIFSDNGRNFVGLMHDFAKFLTQCSSEIIDYATSHRIKFRFTPPYAPHFGSLWEAGVKSCKFHLRRVVGNANLTFEEFSTVLTQIEAVLNSRPLSPMSSDPHDYLPLSPGHFLIGRTLTSPATEDLQLTPTHRLNRYQLVEQIRQHFWERWAKEYVSELQTRSKWRVNCENLQPNTLVLIKDDNLPPLKWHLGRIIKTIPGRDGISRVADIQTEAGIVRRAYTKLCPLVSQSDDTTADAAAQDSS